jgi:subtilisin family serine protease
MVTTVVTGSRWWAVASAVVAVAVTVAALPASAATSATENPAPWNLDRIDQAHRPLNGTYSYPASAGAGVYVFVLSTGINLEHVEFGGRASFGANFVAGESSGDFNGSGTHLAGIVAGKTYGVAKRARVESVKISDRSGTASWGRVINGLSWARGQVTAHHLRAVIILDVIGSHSQAVNDAISSTVDAGVPVVVPAGNTASDACTTSPGSAPSAITVGATNRQDERATFSNSGPCVDLFAPGQDIGAAANPNSIAYRSGTGSAAAHVAGELALALARYGNLSPVELIEHLLAIASYQVIGGTLLPDTPNRLLRTTHA